MKTVEQARQEFLILQGEARRVEIQKEVDRLLLEKQKIRSMSPEQLDANFFPFRDEKEDDGLFVLQCKSGVTIWLCTKAAQYIADETGKRVSFVFNGRTHTRRPGDKLE